MTETNKHRAEVIEVYPEQGQAAVRFSWRGKDRVECVKSFIGPDSIPLTVGMKGWLTYHLSNRCGIWGFEPFKSQGK
jgi:hypothetical protein